MDGYEGAINQNAPSFISDKGIIHPKEGNFVFYASDTHFAGVMVL